MSTTRMIRDKVSAGPWSSFRLIFFQPSDQTTVLTWLPTPPGHPSNSDRDRSSFSFALTQSDNSGTEETRSYKYSDTSSIVHFPRFHIDLHSLTSLSSLQRWKSGIGGGAANRRINVLLAVLEVEGPVSITIKKGPDAGNRVSMFKMIMGDESGCLCKLTAWREIADLWGEDDMAAKRGDVLFLESALYAYLQDFADRSQVLSQTDVSYTVGDTSATAALTASPFLRSQMTICYRTMPYMHEDNRFRPDLRLGISDAAMGRVAEVVRWFEGMAGLA